MVLGSITHLSYSVDNSDNRDEEGSLAVRNAARQSKVCSKDIWNISPEVQQEIGQRQEHKQRVSHNLLVKRAFHGINHWFKTRALINQTILVI